MRGTGLWLIGALLLAGCGSDRPNKSGVPSDHYRAAIYFCQPKASAQQECATPATAADIAAIRADLEQDPAVRQYRYVSAHDTYLIFRVANPEQARYMEDGDLPASFLVVLTEPGESAVAALKQRYGHRPGVTAVAACDTRPQCSVAMMRNLKIVP